MKLPAGKKMFVKDRIKSGKRLLYSAIREADARGRGGRCVEEAGGWVVGYSMMKQHSC